MSEYNQSQPLVMSSIKIGSYVLTEAELNKFVKLNSYRKIPSEYIGCDVRVNVYTLTEYAALQWIPHPSMGDVAIVYDPDTAKQSYNGTYVYQNPDVGNCLPPTSCDVPPNPETRVINIANWKLVNPTISYEDIVKWNNYMEELGVVRQDIITLRELIGTTEASINALTDNKIALAKTELTTDFKNNDNQVRNEFAEQDTIIQNRITAVDAKFDGEVERIDDKLTELEHQEINDVAELTSKINENKENIRINARDISDLDTKFDRTVEAINTSVDQKTTLLKNEVDSKIAQHTSEIDGKLAGQKTEFSTADLALGTRITTEVSGLNDRIDSEVDTLENKVETEKAGRETADQVLDSKIDTEIAAREAGDTTLNTRITNEVSGLNDRIDSEVDTLENKIETADGILDGKIVTEKTAREAGDTTLNTRITNEVSTLNNTINTKYSEVTTSLNNNVSTLNTVITNKEDALKAIVNQNKTDINTKVDQHVADENLHVTATKQATWDAKIDQVGLANGLATKANITDVYTKTVVDEKFDQVNAYINAKAKQYFQGFFASTAELPLPGQQGWYAVCGSTDTVWVWDVENSAWIDSKATSAVTSVNEKTGVVTLTKVDVGLGLVDNTADADKPISTAQAEALAGKVDKIAGKQLSDNNYTNEAVTEVLKIKNKADKTYVDEQDALKADKTYVDDLPSKNFIGVFETRAMLPLDADAGNFAVVKGDDLVYIWDQGAHDWKSCLDKVYTKSESDQLLTTKVDKVEGKQLSDNNYDAFAVAEVAKVVNKADKTYVDEKIALKANSEYVDSELVKKADKTYVDGELDNKADKTYVDAQDHAIEAAIDNLPSKKFIGVFGTKLDLPQGNPGEFALTTTEDKLWVWDGNLDIPTWVTYYLTREVDSMLSEKATIGSVASLASQVETKAEQTYVDNQLATKVDAIAGKGLSTNDYNNDAVTEVLKIKNKADKTYVDSELTLKADEATVTSRLILKADESSVASRLATKADVTYVDGIAEQLTKFRGYFATQAEILGISQPKNGDYAVCNATGTVWYYKVDANNNGTWIDGDTHGEVTLEQFNTAIASKANSVDVYTKAESDSKFATITTVGYLEGQLNAKAVADQVYTKTAADEKFVTLTSYNTFVGQTNATLDEKANETSVAERLATKAAQTYVNEQLALKADESSVAERFDTKVDKVEGKQLSANDYTDVEKLKLAGVEDTAEVNIIEGVKVDGTSLTVDPTDRSVNIDLTGKADVTDLTALSNLVGSSDSAASPTGSVFARIAQANSDLNTKVDKVAGKQLSTNDYSDAAVAEVAKIALKADALTVAQTYVAKSDYATDMSGKADTTQVQSIVSQLSEKADTSTVQALTATVATKANSADVYTKTVADQTFATIATVGTSSDVANANGSIFARIAALEARIAALENVPTN